MSAASNYTENQVLDHVLRNTAMTQPAALYLALFNNTSGNALINLEAGILTDEVPSGRGYVRKAIAFNAASGGTATNSGIVTFDISTVAWNTITHVAILDASTSGNVLFYGALSTSKTIDVGDTMQVSAGNLSISLA